MQTAPTNYRFIPACAGNTCHYAIRLQPVAVHPRVCGEHTVTNAVLWMYAGSSPRVRGTQPRPVPRQTRIRFIPACAGNTVGGRLEICADAVHPRVCGEHPHARHSVTRTLGSSPRVRGTHYNGYALYASMRFIPACAGNTWAPTGAIGWSAVHPRVCGEHHGGLATISAASGSSPRVRGTLDRMQRKHQFFRFIPACAGNTAVTFEFCPPNSVHPRVCGEHRNK